MAGRAGSGAVGPEWRAAGGCDPSGNLSTEARRSPCDVKAPHSRLDLGYTKRLHVISPLFSNAQQFRVFFFQLHRRPTELVVSQFRFTGLRNGCNLSVSLLLFSIVIFCRPVRLSYTHTYTHTHTHTHRLNVYTGARHFIGIIQCTLLRSTLITVHPGLQSGCNLSGGSFRHARALTHCV